MSHGNNFEEQEMLDLFLDGIQNPVDLPEDIPLIREQSVVQNNQVPPRYEPPQKIDRDKTLYQLNSRNDSDDDEWTYEVIDLDSAGVPIIRIEIEPSNKSPNLIEENHSFDSNLNPTVPSPENSYCVIPPRRKEDFLDNKTNQNPRSRKPSISSKMAKMSIGDKPSKGVKKQEPLKIKRSRMTKAGMAKLSEVEKKERKKEQNRINSRACNAKKTEKKIELNNILFFLEDNRNIINQENEERKNRIIQTYQEDIYRNDNNSPYGDPQNFKDYINSKTSISLDEGKKIELDRLEKKRKNCDEAFKKFESEKTGSINRGTYGAQKSRAKTNFEIADLQYRTSVFETDILKGEKIGEVLCQHAVILNQHLMQLKRPCLPVEMEYNRVKKTKPR